MKFPSHVLEQIKLRAPILEEVRRVVPKVQKKGKYWWACCPFHGEKSASFHVREDQNSYYCFGCGAAGDVIKFVQETQGIGFAEAVERLAKQAGVTLPERQESSPEKVALWDDGKRALERAAVFYQRSLNADARAYIAKRQLSEATVAEFGLGFSPESYTATSEALLTEGFKPATLRAVGLALESERGKGDYDRFRGRLMFPIHNMKGEVVGFGGRVMGKGEPKYLNSPETPWFNKGGLLYNLHRAKPHFKVGVPVLVEGYMDVIALWQAGFKTALAPMGTAVGTDQLALLWQQHPSPIVCLDGDNAGRNAAVRAAMRALPVLEPGKTLQFAFLPDGEDPDSLVQKDGLGAFRTILAAPQSLEAMLWQHISAGLDLASADGRASADTKLAEVLNDIKHPTVKAAYKAALRDKIYKASRGQGPNGGNGAGAKRKPNPNAPMVPLAIQAPESYQPTLQGDPTLRLMLAYVCRWPQLMVHFDEAVGALPFEAGPLAELQHHLLRGYVAGHMSDAETAAEYAQTLLDGPFATTVEDLLRNTGVAVLQHEGKPEDLFASTYSEWQARDSARKAQKSALKTTNFLDPEAWASFSQRPEHATRPK